MKEYVFRLTFAALNDYVHESVKVSGVESLQAAFMKAVETAGNRALRGVDLIDYYTL